MRADRSWEIALLVPAARAPRNRRPIEVAFIASAALVVALAAVIAKAAPEVDDKVGGALDAVLGWAPYFCRLVFVLALALPLVIVLDVVLGRRSALAGDLLIALVVTGAVGVFPS